MAKKYQIQTQWGIRRMGGGYIVPYHANNREDAIRLHCKEVGWCWPRCKKEGDAVVRIKIIYPVN